MNQLDNLTLVNKYFDINDKKSEIIANKLKYDHDVEKAREFIEGDSFEKSFIEEKLSKISLKTLEEELKDESKIDYFFTDSAGNILEINENIIGIKKNKEYEFKRELLLLLKSSQEANEVFDKELEKLKEATKEFEDEMKKTGMMLDDIILGLIEKIKKDLSNTTDQKTINEMEKTIEYLESGYNLNIIINTIIKNPSIIQNTVSDFFNPFRVKNIMERYMSKLKSAKTTCMLLNIMSFNPEVLSFEERFFLPGKYIKLEKFKDFLLFSLVRFFALEKWDKYTKIFHTTVYTNLYNLYFEKDINDTTRETIINNYSNYYNMYRKELDKFI